jgi:imidazolonepropionase-like amidohydrolase
VDVPAGATTIDGAGKYVTPGIIDTHSHIGVYPNPGVRAHSDGNEATDPTTPEVWAEHSFWPQDPNISRALAGGVTTIQVLPGSANLMGGRSVTVKLVPGRTVEEMKFPGAPYGMKMACGENPKRVYRNRGPSTRMGEFADDRQEFQRAVEYKRRWDRWERERKGDPPSRDLGMETLKGILEGKIHPQIHCYRADEMVHMINLSKEFDFRIRSFHHAVEAYKIRDFLAREEVSASMWADWWGFKMEAYDAVRANVALVHDAGARAIVHSDSEDGIQRLNQEAAKAMAAGRAAGIEITEEDAIRWITINPAWAIGVDDHTGSLEPGKMADVVVWSANPLSVYAKAEKVFIDGALVYDRSDPARQPISDFEKGQVPVERMR